MCPQEPSPHKKFRNPANLIDEFMYLVGVILFIPHRAILCFVAWVDPQRDRRNR